MDWSRCPAWIVPGNAFRLVVKVSSWVAEDEYGNTFEMAEQEHELWIDKNQHYTLAKFDHAMSTKLVWGPKQKLAIWVVELDSSSKWKIRRDEHFQKLILDRWNENFAVLAIDVVSAYDECSAGPSNVNGPRSGLTSAHGSAGPSNAHPSVIDQGSGASGTAAGSVAPENVEASAVPITDNVEGSGEACSSPPPYVAPEQAHPVDWAELTILQGDDDDGEAKQAADEDKVYEAMGFAAVHERAEDIAREGIPIPNIPAEVQDEMAEAAIPVDDQDNAEPMFEWDRDNPDLSVGVSYPSMAELRKAVRQHAIVKRFELGTAHSDTERFRGFCASLGCPWIIRARTQHDGSVRVQINEGTHLCASRNLVPGAMASQAWVEERAIPFLKRIPTMGPTALKAELDDKYKLDIKYQTVVYGRKRAVDKLFGKLDDSFDWLYRFKAEVEMRSPGSIVEVDSEEVDGQFYFTRFFCCFKAAIDGFRNGCRPYLSIDSTHLNGLWNGQLASAQALDGHNWMFPVAFGFFGSETKDNWSWFMEQLSKAIGPMENLAVCTDACKGLEAAVAKVWPHCEKRECFRHLMENLKKHYTGDVYAKNMWPAARAYTPTKFRYFFNKVVNASPTFQKWLDDYHNLLWARSKFSTEIKCDYINNNLAECFNAWIKDCKDLPVHCLADAIREKTLTLFAKRRKISVALSPGILPAVIHQLNVASRALGNLKVIKGHPEEAEVSEIYKDEEVRRHVVYLQQHACTCREWQLTGKPCPHALAVITCLRQPDMGMFVHDYYSVEKFQAAYHGIIPHITDRNQWPEVDKGFKCNPPVSGPKKPGRTKKNRHLGPFETTGKRSRQSKCNGCGEYGHREGSWRCSKTGTKKRKRSKKTAPKPGRPKKGKKNQEDEGTSGQHSPRTRLAAAKEAAAKAAKEAQLAADKAAVAAEAAAAAEAVAARATTAPAVPPLDIIYQQPPSPQTPIRNTCLDLQIVNQPDEEPGTRKITPRRKQLATKKMKVITPTKKKSPAVKKKGKKANK